MTDTIHTYEFEYYNGDEWVDCQLYSSVRDDDKMKQEFIKQQEQDNEPYQHTQMMYIGEGEYHCGMDLENGLKLRVF